MYNGTMSAYGSDTSNSYDKGGNTISRKSSHNEGSVLTVAIDILTRISLLSKEECERAIRTAATFYEIDLSKD